MLIQKREPGWIVLGLGDNLVGKDPFPRRHPDTAFRAIGDEGGLVVLPSDAEVKVINSVGAKVFELLDGEHSLDAITEAVVEEFDISHEEARRDIEAFIGDLEANGMLDVAENAGETR
jgi:hypothetical protein